MADDEKLKELLAEADKLIKNSEVSFKEDADGGGYTECRCCE